MKTNWFATLFIAAAFLFSAATIPAATLKAGDTAPLVTGKDQEGKTVNLADFVGKKIVLLYFYPKDFTGGCTAEACGFRDRMADFTKENVEVIGVSFDTADSHQKFAEKYGLNFTLIADPDGKIVDAYGARWDTKNLSRRVSFLIGLDGKIAHVTDAMNPQTHFDEMNAAIGKLKKS